MLPMVEGGAVECAGGVGDDSDWKNRTKTTNCMHFTFSPLIAATPRLDAKM